jgi:phosphocarrier protein
MAERTVTIGNEVGLHARPAALFVKAATETGLDVQVVKGDRVADARSLLSLLTLDVRQGDAIVLRAEGDGADAALDSLATFLGEL